MAKYALIINGDTAAGSLQNVERSLANKFEDEGYETYVASPQKPSAPCDHYVQPTLKDIGQLIAELKANIGMSDELVIYTTGHGDIQEGGVGTLGLQDLFYDYKMGAALLDGIRYGQRTVIMDQCFSGNWNKVFLDDPKTLFISAGSKNEVVLSQEIAPRFWEKAATIPDLNNDGMASWQERYAYAVADVTFSEPQFVPSPGYTPEGRAVFESRVVEVKDENDLADQLSKLTLGQYAVVTFSAERCGPCQVFKPRLNQMAATGGGEHLWIWTEDEALAKKWNVSAYPTVVIVDALGYRKIIKKGEQILEGLARFEVPREERALRSAERSLAAAENIKDTYWRFWVFRDLAAALTNAGLGDKGLSLVRKIKEAQSRH